MSAEAKGVAHHSLQLGFTGSVRDVIQIALGIGFVQIDGGREHLILQRQHCDAGFQSARAALRDPGVWVALVYLGVLATALAFYLMSTLQAHLGNTEAAILYSLEPVFTALLALTGWVPGLREPRLSLLQLLGGAIILAAMILAELGPRWMARFGDSSPERDG